MICKICQHVERKNVWICPSCGNPIQGGVVFVSSISGAESEKYLREVISIAQKHRHNAMLHDVGEIMHKYAKDDDPDVRWDKILDADNKVLRHLRMLAFQEIIKEITDKPDWLHLIDIHFCFRWRAHLMSGMEPLLLDKFKPLIRCFVNIVPDIEPVKERLQQTSWGERKNLELLLWRDEELFLTDVYANICGKLESYVIAAAEPPSLLEKIIWHPVMKKIYLSFPITSIRENQELMNEIADFRDKIREFLIVFNPLASQDYDETYKKPEMKALRKEIGEATEERDYRFIDQADAIVVYFPIKVASKGVDAEMKHARATGKDIYLYAPEDLGGGPFAVPHTYLASNPIEFYDYLKQVFG